MDAPGVLADCPRSFRVGVSSFVLPDHALPNVEFLKHRVDDVQLLFLEPEGDLPGPEELARMVEIRAGHGLSYSLHLPTLVALEGEPRQRSVEAIAAMLELAAPLEPLGGVLHVVPAPPEQQPALGQWLERAAAGLGEISARTGVPIAQLAVENQWAYDVDCNRQLAELCGCSLCLDLGHIHHADADPLPLLEAHLDRAPHLHVHGVDDRDHRALEYFPYLGRVLRLLQARQYRGVMTVEVFGEQPFEASLNSLREAWPDPATGART